MPAVRRFSVFRSAPLRPPVGPEQIRDPGMDLHPALTERASDTILTLLDRGAERLRCADARSLRT